MIIVSQLLMGLIFLFLTLPGLTLPGLFFLRKIKLDFEDMVEKYTLSTVFGLVVFTLFAYFLAAINLKLLIWVFPLLGLWSILKFKKEILNFKIKISNKTFFFAVLIVGIIGQVAVNAPSGLPYNHLQKTPPSYGRDECLSDYSLPWNDRWQLKLGFSAVSCKLSKKTADFQSAEVYKDGIYFWSSHGHDGIWHLALMDQMHKNIFPFQNPEVAGQKLQNYHFFSDLLMSEFSRMFPFSNLDIYFRFMPVLFSLTLGLSAFLFVKLWSKSELAGIWAMIFTYFAGSFGYLLYIPTHKSLGGESIFWVSQTQSVLGNPPHAAAFIITTVFLFCLLKYLDTRKFRFFLLCTILGGSVIGFKVYAGVLIIGGLLILGLYELLFKRVAKTMLLFLATLLVALIIYLPNSANSQDFLIWHPWWYIRTMVVASDRLNWLDLELRRQTYIAEGNLKRVIQVETMSFLIFLFGNLGMRFLGFWAIFKKSSFKDSFNLFFLSITLASFVIPVLFLQKGIAWNSIQFNQYFLLFFGFLASLTMADILSLIKTNNLKIGVSLIVVILAIPTQLGLLWQFYSNPPLAKISYEELAALNFLKQHASSDSVILTAPFNKYEKEKYSHPPIPIYAWYDTGYVPAFSGKKTLISDQEQINIMGYDVSKLLQDRNEAFQSADYHIMNNFLKRNNIDYVYLVWDQKIATDSSYLNADLVFQNKDAKLFKVRK